MLISDILDTFAIVCVSHTYQFFTEVQGWKQHYLCVCEMYKLITQKHQY